MTTDTITVDDLNLALRRSERRQTVGITVERDGALTVAAPLRASVTDIEAVIRQKQFWIYQKLAEKELLRGSGPRPREFVNGEGFPYLGRSYRLRIESGSGADVSPLRLFQGRFRLRRDALPEAKRHFINWYGVHGEKWFGRYVARYADRLEVQVKDVIVQDLGYRWGSCGRGNVLYFHWRTVCLPPRIIRYVVVHELAHLHEAHHTAVFWRRVERAMPDYEERAAWLAQHGKEYAIHFAC